MRGGFWKIETFDGQEIVAKYWIKSEIILRIEHLLPRISIN